MHEFTRDEIARFWAKVDRSDSCWLWCGSRYRKGYGQFAIKRQGRWRRVGSHRYAWEVTYGPIPPGVFVCHSCDTPQCVNPSHLWLGTVADNQRDMVAKGRQATGDKPGVRGDRNGSRRHPECLVRGERHHQARLTVDQVLAIYSLKESGRSMTSIGRELAVSRSTVRDIWRGDHWSEVTGAQRIPPDRDG